MLYCSIVLCFVLQGFVIRHYDELCSASRIGILVSLIIVFQNPGGLESNQLSVRV